jgi:predicted PurR-regulated permease PerM
MSPLSTPRDRARVLLLALGAGILVACWPFIPGLIGAAVLYVMFRPLHDWLARYVRPRVAANLVLGAVVAGVLIPGTVLLALILAQAPAALDAFINRAMIGRIAEIEAGGVSLGMLLAGAGDELQAALPTQAFNLFGSLVRTALNTMVSLFGLHFLLLSRDRAWELVKAYLPLSNENADTLRTRFRSVTEAMLVGVALTAVLQGSVVGLGFWLTQLPDPLFWGSVTACVSVLPVFGSAFVWLPATIVLLAKGQIAAAGVMFVIGAVIASNIDNVTRPLVYWRFSHLHPMTTLLGAFAGVGVFGLSGILIGPLALSYFFEVLGMYRAEYPSATAPVGPA